VLGHSGADEDRIELVQVFQIPGAQNQLHIQGLQLGQAPTQLRTRLLIRR